MKKVVFTLILLSFTLSGCSQIIRKRIPDKLVVFTFDDATASQYSFVAPLLKEYGFGATFFVCEFPPNFSDTSRYMNWRQIKELDKMGFEIANHTRNHPNLPAISIDKVEYQLKYIDDKCDSIGIAKPLTFAYPGYGLDSVIVDYLGKRGFIFARAGGDRPYDPLADHPLLVPSWAMTSKNKEQIMNAFTQAKDGKIVVLTIHGVPDIEHPWVDTPPELFREYLEFLRSHSYKVISLSDLAEYLNTDEALKLIRPDVEQNTQRY
ncbi:MAG: polysaccharide deacetylase family protein [Bacteroidales bacterium]|jgi:peptidoglycan/xylan/chitin deacetylase (PgdA/CDA1 family)|nr:polysaccharide deacetylase family protein [Bacteroidales bacterium]